MNRNGYPSLALFLLVAGTVGASEGPDRSATPAAAEIKVPNIPPELSAPLTAPAPVAAAGDTSADLAGPDTGVRVNAAQPPVPPPPIDSCNTADCLSAASKPATQTGKRNSGPLTTPSIRIGKPAQQAITESHDWAENPVAMPLRDAGGRVIFPFSESAPTIVCAPLRVCDIELQAGEVVQGAPHIGDAVRWKVAPAVSGSDDRKVTHLIVKPTEAGLDTNLIIPTDRHTYHIRLVSSAEQYVASVAFDYPEEQQQAWKSFAKTSAGSDSTDVSGDMPVVAVNRLNFNYKIKVVKGKPTFKPLRAMDDGYHTYIAMNEDLPQREAPVLVGISPSGAEQMINYRLKGNLYVLDGTIFKLALISGVGRDQQRVELTREPCSKRGWLGICWDAKE
jgi:type IV secretion system protein TrbG